MTIEDRILDAMTAHEQDAPTAAEFSARLAVPVGRSRGRWLPALAAASVVLAVVGAVVAIRATGGGHRTAPAAALTCPRTYRSPSSANGLPGVWVPEKPHGVDSTTRLVPQQTPTRVVICAYLHAPDASAVLEPTTLPMTGSAELTGDLARVQNALSWLPGGPSEQGGPCAQYLANTDRDAYLIGLTYASGTVWVSTPGDHCAGSSNGMFETSVNLREPVAAAFATGRWTANPSQTQSGDRDPCHVGTAGRVGQEKAMVPGDPVSATVCQIAASNQSSAVARKDVKDLRALAAALNSHATRPSSQTCVGSGGGFYEVLFRYAIGPPVFVRVSPGCRPSIDNLSLQAEDLRGAMTVMIKELLVGR